MGKFLFFIVLKFFDYNFSYSKMNHFGWNLVQSSRTINVLCFQIQTHCKKIKMYLETKQKWQQRYKRLFLKRCLSLDTRVNLYSHVKHKFSLTRWGGTL